MPSLRILSYIGRNPRTQASTPDLLSAREPMGKMVYGYRQPQKSLVITRATEPVYIPREVG